MLRLPQYKHLMRIPAPDNASSSGTDWAYYSDDEVEFPEELRELQHRRDAVWRPFLVHLRLLQKPQAPMSEQQIDIRVRWERAEARKDAREKELQRIAAREHAHRERLRREKVRSSAAAAGATRDTVVTQ